MRESLSCYLRKLVACMGNLSTRPLEEQTPKDKETAPRSLPNNPGTPLGKTDPHALLREKKSQKRRIPFVALALVLLFACLSFYCLLSLHPKALADSPPNPPSDLPPDATVVYVTPPPTVVVVYTYPTPEAAPFKQTTSYLLSKGNVIVGHNNPCKYYQSHLLSGGAGSAPVPFCWDEDDFRWGLRDITCIANDAYTPGTAIDEPFNGTVQTGPAPHRGRVWEKPPTASVSGEVKHDGALRNQNTCTDHSTCVSDNATGQDRTALSTTGDNIVCSNNNCTTSQAGNTNECGDGPPGEQLEYDRFACKMIDNEMRHGGENTTFDNNDAGINKGYRWDWHWDSTGVAINPTAFDPNGALYLPTTVLHSKPAGVRPTRDRPKCDASNHWQCGNENGTQDSLFILIEEGNFAEGTISDSDGNKHLNKVVVPNHHHVPIFWVACNSGGGGWAFPCSDLNASSGPYGGNAPFINPNENNTLSLDNGQVNEAFIKDDWLSGDYDSAGDKRKAQGSAESKPDTPKMPEVSPGHLEYTYHADTVSLDGVQNKLFPLTLAVGFAFIAPIMVLIGYQLLFSSWTLVNVSLMEALGRMILSIVAVSSSYFLVSMLIDLANTFNIAIVTLHAKLGYTDFHIGIQSYSFGLAPQGETADLNPRVAESFRGIVLPISRWGCIANDFVALLANKFWTDAAGYVPFVGGIAKFIGNVFNAIDFAHHIGEFVVLILSIMLCTQVMTRIILLNYYILTGPVAFACWGLPWGVGQNVVRQWAKGLFSLLFTQTIQIFILTTLPLIMPDLPGFPTDTFGIIDTILAAIPRIIVLVATIQVPRYMGTQATRAVAQAGTVVGGAVAAAGAAAMNVV